MEKNEGGEMSMDYTTSLHGHCPRLPWTPSVVSMDIFTVFMDQIYFVHGQIC